jgi:hypothetical protein
MVHSFDHEKEQLLKLIQELEHKNRGLNTKLNMKIYNAAD